MIRRRTAIAVVLWCAVTAACKRSQETAPIAWPDHPSNCRAPTGPSGEWQHKRNHLVAALGESHHVATDVVVPTDAAPTLNGKFAYGKVSKDLESEPIAVFVADDSCNARQVGQATTDHDGRLSFPAARLPAGYHHYWLVAGPDHTYADGGIWSLGHRTQAVVFDIDGTLTIDDGELFEELVGGQARAFAGAAAVVQRWADKGYLIIYVTGRPYPLRARTRQWLEHNRFPYGALFTPDRLRDGLPTHNGVGAYKRGVLRQLQAAGVQIVRAYGNAATDVCAYAQAKISPEASFIIGARGGCDGATAPRTLTDYIEHLADVDQQPAASR